MKDHIQELLHQSLLYLQRDGVLPEEAEIAPQLEHARSAEHGDYASNVAMVLAKQAGMNPGDLAKKIRDRMPESRQLEKVEPAGPGFLNFYVKPGAMIAVVNDVLAAGEKFGHGPANSLAPVTVEFVSANPTGPLHVGHGRGAAYGASLANLLEAAGHRVQREYYVNDNGRQMDILAASTWLRYLELCGENIRFPDAGYQGDYVYDIARKVRQDQGDECRFRGSNVTDDLPPDGSQLDSEDPDEVRRAREKHIDAVIATAREMLGPENYQIFFDAALNSILDDIRQDLADFGVHYDEWFSERQLQDSGAIAHAVDRLKSAGHLYEKDGAVWFAAEALGDEKDRVLIRENGRGTYFASDVAYFLNKLERGFERALYVFGADHHGYIARLQAAASGLEKDPEQLEILLVQFAVLYRGGEKVQMSTRSGKFVTLRALREEVGRDAARFFYVMRSHEQHLDFDLDLAKSQSQDNPVYYIQYAHARIRSVFAALAERDWRYNAAIGEAAIKLLDSAHEEKLARVMNRYPDVLASAARNRAPHQLAHYLQDLATAFHSYYNAEQFLVDDENLRNARLNLIAATGQIIAAGLDILGVSAPEKMESRDNGA